MNDELIRIKDLAVGEHWIADPKLMLFSILTNVAAKDAHMVGSDFKSEYGGEIPPSYADAAKLLYKVVGNSSAEELKSFGYDMTSERVCDACLDYLGAVLPPAELASFKAATPIKKPHSIVQEIFQMIKDN